jgi:hypothetical protein
MIGCQVSLPHLGHLGLTSKISSQSRHNLAVFRYMYPPPSFHFNQPPDLLQGKGISMLCPSHAVAPSSSAGISTRRKKHSRLNRLLQPSTASQSPLPEKFGFPWWRYFLSGTNSLGLTNVDESDRAHESDRAKRCTHTREAVKAPPQTPFIHS